MTVRLKGDKQRKLNDNVYSCLLFVYSRSHYQAEFSFNTSKVAYCWQCVKRMQNNKEKTLKILLLKIKRFHLAYIVRYFYQPEWRLVIIRWNIFKYWTLSWIIYIHSFKTNRTPRPRTWSQHYNLLVKQVQNIFDMGWGGGSYEKV